jgi:hypothetical protein
MHKINADFLLNIINRWVLIEGYGISLFSVRYELNYDEGFKGKGKVRGWGLYSTEALWLIVLLTPKEVPSFMSRGAAHQRRTAASASEGRNYRWNLANHAVIHVSC